MTRKALIIGSPDAKIPGVYEDMKNYREFLVSPNGGGWYNFEITTLESPTPTQVREQLLNMKGVDYSFVVFAGHGYYSAAKRCTVVELRQNAEMEEHDLKAGGRKHTLIIDACRVVVQKSTAVKAAMDSAMEGYRQRASLAAHRQLFDEALDRCAPGIATLYSCGLNETAGDIEGVGGRYSSELLLTSTMKTNKTNCVLSVSDAHELTKPGVNRSSGGRQNPTGEFPRTLPRFPFAVGA